MKTERLSLQVLPIALSLHLSLAADAKDLHQRYRLLYTPSEGLDDLPVPHNASPYIALFYFFDLNQHSFALVSLQLIEEKPHPSAAAMTSQVAALSHMLTSAHGAKFGLPTTGTTNIARAASLLLAAFSDAANKLQHFPSPGSFHWMCLRQKKQYEKGRAKPKTALQEKGCSSPQPVHRWDQLWSVAALRVATLPDPNPHQGNSLSRETKWGMEKVNCTGNNALSSTQYMQYHLLRKPSTTTWKCASHSLLSQPIRLFGDLQFVHLLQIKALIPLG